MSARPIIAALGDSLTAGEHADTTPLHNHPWSAYLDSRLFPYTGVGNFGLGGDIVSNMKTRYESFIKGVGFDYLILWGGVNDIVADTSAAAIWASMEALVDEAIADGQQVLLVFTPGFGAYGAWTVGRQAQLDALRALMMAKTGVTKVDLYQPAPAGVNDPANPLNILPAYRIADGLHLNPTGQLYVAQLMLAAVTPLLPPVPAPPEPGPEVTTFGVDAEAVRKAHFPHQTAFSARTNPTADTVATIISEEASDLAGELRLKSVDPTSITETTSEAFVWCAKTLKLAAALRIYVSTTAANPDGAKALQTQFDNRMAWLQKHGLELAGAQTIVSGSGPEGPTSHISQYGLRTADSSRMSSTESPFHKDDQL